MSDDFEVDGIFDNIKPDDFHRSTSARHVAVMDVRPKLDAFVAQSLDGLRMCFLAADGQPNPVAVMYMKDKTKRMFSPDDDENLGQYINRLHREANQHGASAVFTSVLTVGGLYEGDDEGTIDSDEAVAKIEPTPCLYWFAQMGTAVRHGIMAIEDGVAGEVFEAPAEHASPLYRTILGE